MVNTLYLFPLAIIDADYQTSPHHLGLTPGNLSSPSTSNSSPVSSTPTCAVCQTRPASITWRREHGPPLCDTCTSGVAAGQHQQQGYQTSTKANGMRGMGGSSHSGGSKSSSSKRVSNSVRFMRCASY